jgi:cysteine desulfurase
MVYFDYNATTPPDPTVARAVADVAARAWGNPSSIHRVGREARDVLDDARYRLARLWSCRPSEVVFTSGGTESANLAVLGSARLRRDRGRHVVASSVEHHAVLHAVQHLVRHEGFEATWLPVDPEGRVDPGDVARSLRPDTVLVSVMAANNEVGTVQPVGDIARMCREKGVLFHTDAVQAFGKLPMESLGLAEADLVSACAHKVHGPRGVGALRVRSPLLPQPILHGGGHENERRAGTENLAGILGMVEAFERFTPTPVFPAERLRCLTERLAEGMLAVRGVHRRGAVHARLPNTVAFSVEGADAISLLANLDLAGICASSGSACSAGSLEPSHVLAAMGVPRDQCSSLVRLSLGRESTDADVEAALAAWPGVVARARGRPAG